MGDQKVLSFEEAVEAAKERLASSLVPAEREELMGQRFELNAALKWGRIAEKGMSDLLGFAEELLFERTPFSKGNELPIENLFDKGEYLEDLENGGDRTLLRRHFLILLAAKKILGILKSRVKEELKFIQTIDSAEEQELMEVIEASQDFSSQGREEEQEKVGAIPLPPPTPTTPSEEDMGEIVIQSKKKGKKPKPECAHIHTRTSYYKDSQGNSYEHVFCKMCNSFLEGGRVIEAKISKKKSEACKHPSAIWVPGQEGKVARCGEENCGAVIKKPQTYRWRESGLEAYGDDPTKDETLFFGGEKEMQA